MLTPEENRYILEWWRNGNEWRSSYGVNSSSYVPAGLLECQSRSDRPARLNAAGITLAKAPDALELAYGEYFYLKADEGHLEHAQEAKMHSSLRELLGDG